MKQKRNAFGLAETQTIRITSPSLNLPLFAMLCLQPAQPDEEWWGMLYAATNWGFRNAFPSKFNEADCSFEIYYSRRPEKFLPIILKNTATDGKTRLLSFQSASLHHIKNSGRTLPNQLSLFGEENIPDTLDVEDPQYEHNNPDDLRRWNELTAFMARHSVPLGQFRYLMPFQFEDYDRITPFLNHILKMEGLQFRYLSGNLLENDHLFYQISICQQEIRQRIYKYPGKYSSNEWSL